MRKRFAVIFFSGVVVITGGGWVTASPAGAVCGDGGPGEPCHCPPGIGVPGKKPIIPIYC